ncbi:hypothetical protein [Cellulomonas sp. URHB0016]
MRPTTRLTLALVIGVVGAVAMSGCSATAPSAASATQDSREARAGALSDDAQDTGKYDASQQQALADGAVDYEEYEGAINRALDCMRDAGIDVNVEGTSVVNGTTRLMYTYELDSNGAADGCYQKYAVLVDQAWQTLQPGQADWDERRDAATRPALEECLRRNGVDFTADASMDDLLVTASTYSVGHPAIDCVTESGYMTWNG